MKKSKEENEFWVTNTCYNKDVSLGDLRVTIRAGQTVNLLDSKHYYYTIEQLRESAESGSLKRRSKIIKIIDRPKPVPVKPGIYEAKKPMLSRQIRLGQQLRSSEKPEIKKFEILGDSVTSVKKEDEQFAIEDSEFVFDDNVPALAVDKVYKKDKDK